MSHEASFGSIHTPLFGEGPSVDSLALRPQSMPNPEIVRFHELAEAIRKNPGYANRFNEIVIRIDGHEEKLLVPNPGASSDDHALSKLLVSLPRIEVDCTLSKRGTFGSFGLRWNGNDPRGGKKATLVFENGSFSKATIYSSQFQTPTGGPKREEIVDQSTGMISSDLTVGELIEEIKRTPSYCSRTERQEILIIVGEETFSIRHAPKGGTRFDDLLGKSLASLPSFELELRLSPSAIFRVLGFSRSFGTALGGRLIHMDFRRGELETMAILSEKHQHPDGRPKQEQIIGVRNWNTASELTLRERLVDYLEANPQPTNSFETTYTFEVQGEQFVLPHSNGACDRTANLLLEAIREADEVTVSGRLSALGQLNAWGLSWEGEEPRQGKNVSVQFKKGEPQTVSVFSDRYCGVGGTPKREEIIDLANRTIGTELSIDELFGEITRQSDYSQRDPSRVVTIRVDGGIYQYRLAIVGGNRFDRLLGEALLKKDSVKLEGHLPPAGALCALSFKWHGNEHRGGRLAEVTFSQGEPKLAFVLSEIHRSNDGYKAAEILDLETGEVATGLSLEELITEIEYSKLGESSNGRPRLVLELAGKRYYLRQILPGATNLESILCRLLQNREQVIIEGWVPEHGHVKWYGHQARMPTEMAGKCVRAEFSRGKLEKVSLLTSQLCNQSPSGRDANFQDERCASPEKAASLYVDLLEQTGSAERAREMLLKVLSEEESIPHTMEYNFLKGRVYQRLVWYWLLREGQHVLPEAVFTTPILAFPDFFWLDSKRIADAKFGGSPENVASTAARYQQLVNHHQLDSLTIFHLRNEFSYPGVSFIKTSGQFFEDSALAGLAQYILELDSTSDSLQELAHIESLLNHLLLRRLHADGKNQSPDQLLAECYEGKPLCSKDADLRDDVLLCEFLTKRTYPQQVFDFEGFCYNPATGRFESKTEYLPSDLKDEVIAHFASSKAERQRVLLKRLWIGNKLYLQRINRGGIEITLDDFIEEMREAQATNPELYRRLVQELGKRCHI